MNDMTTKSENPLVKLHAQLETRTLELEKALPKHIPVERFTRVVMTAVQNNPKLLTADRVTLFNSAMKAAQDGLLPDGREGALVIYNTKMKINGAEQWVDAVQWMPMIAGIRKKVRNSGEIATWDAKVVYERDEFYYEDGLELILRHKPYLDGDPGQVKAAYSVCHMKTGEVSVDVMPRWQIDRIRLLSKAKDAGPWKDHYAEMAKKTVARRHSKVLPMSTDLDDLIRRDDALYDFEGASDKKQVNAPKRPQLSDFSAVESAKPTDAKPVKIETPAEAEPVEEQKMPPPETHDAQTGEVLGPGGEPYEDGPDHLTVPDAFELGKLAARNGKPRRVPKEIAEFSEACENAWLDGWNEADANKAEAKKK